MSIISNRLPGMSAQEMYDILSSRPLQPSFSHHAHAAPAIGGNANHTHTLSGAQRLYSDIEKLQMRMGWQGSALGFGHVAVHRVGNVVHVWLVTSDAKSTVIEDGGELFPSDTLITQLRMLQS